MTKDLKRAFSLQNLKLAWKWILSNPETKYKNYFRHIYRAYSIRSEDNLRDLSARLQQGVFDPTLPVRIYYPKQSGILRPYTLLAIEDQIVYQALANVVAPRLHARIRKRYGKLIFGNLYAGQDSTFFFQDWRRGYRAFTRAFLGGVRDGYRYTATFDLTAYFDSIDHDVLKHQLLKLNLEPEFCDYLNNLLRKWTACSNGARIEKRHGLPQGPLASALLADCVLKYFDDVVSRTRSVKYLRYVDDIRILAKDEKGVRKKLVDLDFASKELGLFPQSAKIAIHLVTCATDEVKILDYGEWPHRQSANQHALRREVVKLSSGYVVKKGNETRFKFLLTKIIPDAQMAKRLVEIVERQPHLSQSVFSCLQSSRALSLRASERCLNFLHEDILYPSVYAGLLRVLRHRYHPGIRNPLHRICRRLCRHSDAELQAEAASILLVDNAIEWKTIKELMTSTSWWTRSVLLQHVRKDMIGKPSFDVLVRQQLKDNQADVALVAAITAAEQSVELPRPHKGMHKLAQISLKAAGLIGKISKGQCPVANAFAEVLDAPFLRTVNWRRISGKHYKAIIKRMGRWKGYASADPTAWVNLTDTINDLLLDSLREQALLDVKHTLANFKDIMDPNSPLIENYPRLLKAVRKTHEFRLLSDLSHPMNRRTQKYTRYITYREVQKLKKLLLEGYRELWENL